MIGIKKMRVLCITEHSDRPEAEMFIGLKKRGVDLYVICPSSAPHYTRLIKAGIPVVNMQLKSKIDFNCIKKIRHFLIENKIQILHLFNNKAVSNGIFSSTKLPVKIIAYRGIVANISFFNPISWITYLHPRVDHIICVAEEVRQFFLGMKFLWLHVKKTKPITIYKGHSLAWYKNEPTDLSEFGIPKNAFVVVCIANYRPRKGIHIFIESARYLPKNMNIHFLLVGEMNTTKIVKQIKKSPFKEKIHLTGFRPDAPEISASCDVIVLPALRREGLPKVIIEAMAYGVAPIVTDSGGSPELIEKGKSGFIVPSGDAKAIAEKIIQLYKNPDLCKQVGKNAKTRIETAFRIEDTINKTYELYKKMTNP